MISVGVGLEAWSRGHKSKDVGVSASPGWCKCCTTAAG